MRENRPTLREIFFRADRRLDVHFYTSNIDKFLQARAVFEKCGLILRHFRSRTDPYHEDYTIGKEALLSRALDEVQATVGAASIFFVEDTSIRVDALSTASQDFPGLAAKEWFASTDFAEVDRALRAEGNVRSASVKSDIGLHLPNLRRPLFFHGETRGEIASSPPEFSASIQHPWLTPATFNGWLIPHGARKRLGEMSFEESWPYDFRVESLLKVIDRLEEYTAALNLPPSAYSRRTSTTAPAQLSLLQTRREILVVVGRTCAGKTTMAERLSAEHGYTCFEASSILRTFQDPNSENAGGSNTTGDQGFAERILNRFGPDAVARRLLELIEGTHIERLAVSGFRTIEELECIRAHFPEARVVLVYASDRTRYERRIKRARADEGLTFEQFNRLDQSQWSFGLLRVAEELADIRIVNEGTLDEFYSKIGSVVSGDFGAPVAGVSQMLRPRHWSSTNQLVRCLEVLSAAARPLDCAEIEEGTSNAGFKVRHNNANKVLKAAGELARRIEMPNCRVRYRISDAGRAYLRLLHQRESAEGPTGAERQLRDDQ